VGGLQKIAKLYGGIKVNGVDYVWDYATDEAVRKEEMPPGSERWKASEKAKWAQLKEKLDHDKDEQA
jgi:hypothetical protein